MRQYKSRLSEVEEQKNMKAALIFGGLTVLILLGVIVFGIPLITKLANLLVKNPVAQTPQNNITLLPPNLSIPPQYTNQASVVIKGTATPNSIIKIFFNNSSDKTTADANGNFTMNISLTKGANTIYAETLDANANASSPSTSYTINYTNQTPNLTVNVPQNNQNFYGSSQQNLNIQGSTDPNNTLTINDHIAVLDNSGNFNYSFVLQNGENDLKVISQDQAGNKKEIDLKVTFNP